MTLGIRPQHDQLSSYLHGWISRPRYAKRLPRWLRGFSFFGVLCSWWTAYFFAPKWDSQMQSKDLTTVDQRELPLSRKPAQASVPVELVVKQPSFAGAIALCVQVSGLEEKEVYLSLDIDAGHWTRIMKGDAHFPVNKLNSLMDLCGNESPLIWLSHSRGYGLVMLKSEAERRAELAENRADEAEKKLQWAMEIMQKVAA